VRIGIVRVFHRLWGGKGRKNRDRTSPGLWGQLQKTQKNKKQEGKKAKATRKSQTNRKKRGGSKGETALHWATSKHGGRGGEGPLGGPTQPSRSANALTEGEEEIKTHKTPSLALTLFK